MLADGARLQGIAVRRSDLPAGSTIALIPGGSLVQGQVTLDNCGYHFTSERHRVARRQYDITDAGTYLGNELVSYGSAGQAAAALAEYHRSVTSCPKGYTTSTVAGEPALKVSVVSDRTRVAALPVITNEIVTEKLQDHQGDKVWATLIFQVRNRDLDGLYLTTRVAPSAANLRLATTLATITGKRLAAAG